MKTKPRPYPPGHAQGVKNGRARLSEEEVRTIREIYQAGRRPSHRELAEAYSCTRSNISRLLHRKSWKHI